MEFILNLVDDDKPLFDSKPEMTKIVYEFHCVDGDGNQMYAVEPPT